MNIIFNAVMCFLVYIMCVNCDLNAYVQVNRTSHHDREPNRGKYKQDTLVIHEKLSKNTGESESRTLEQKKSESQSPIHKVLTQTSHQADLIRLQPRDVSPTQSLNRSLRQTDSRSPLLQETNRIFPENTQVSPQNTHPHSDLMDILPDQGKEVSPQTSKVYFQDTSNIYGLQPGEDESNPPQTPERSPRATPLGGKSNIRAESDSIKAQKLVVPHRDDLFILPDSNKDQKKPFKDGKSALKFRQNSPDFRENKDDHPDTSIDEDSDVTIIPNEMSGKDGYPDVSIDSEVTIIPDVESEGEENENEEGTFPIDDGDVIPDVDNGGKVPKTQITGHETTTHQTITHQTGTPTKRVSTLSTPGSTQKGHGNSTKKEQTTRKPLRRSTIDGDAAVPKLFKYIVYLNFNYSYKDVENKKLADNKYATGTIISPTWVVTSLHIVPKIFVYITLNPYQTGKYKTEKLEVNVEAGTVESGTNSIGVQKTVSKHPGAVWCHPKGKVYQNEGDLNGEVWYMMDVALVHLNTVPLVFDSFVGAAQLVRGPFPVSQIWCQLVGFAKIEGGKRWKLYSTKVSVGDKTFCTNLRGRFYSFWPKSYHICALGSKGKWGCFGDSGSGLICYMAQTPSLVGVLNGLWTHVNEGNVECDQAKEPFTHYLYIGAVNQWITNITSPTVVVAKGSARPLIQGKHYNLLILVLCLWYLECFPFIFDT